MGYLELQEIQKKKKSGTADYARIFLSDNINQVCLWLESL